MKRISIALSALAGICLLMLSSCSKDAPFAAHANSQAFAAASGQSPVLRIISPYSGETFAVGDSVFFQATVGDTLSDSSSAWHGAVSFYRNNVLIATDSMPPYACVWKASALGQNVLVAEAFSGGTAIASDTVTVTVRDAFISISSPYNGQVFPPGASIQILATPIATARHTVAGVDFYRNGSFLGSVWRAPYSYMWNNAAKGSYVLKVVAHDTKGRLDSAKVNVTVFNVPPSVYLYSPANGAVFFKGDTVLISASASDSDGSVSSVSFYKNGKRLGTVAKRSDSTRTFSFPWYDTTLGTFTLTAKAVDNGGDTGYSDSVTVTRTDGFIVLTAPGDGQIFETGSAITVSASAVEAKYHTVKNVKLYRNNKLLAAFTKAPFQYMWQNAANGTYRMMAVATDTKGRVDTSNAATVVVKAMPPSIYLSASGESSGSTGIFLQSDSLVLYPYLQDSTGSAVASVKYYENGKLIATKTAQPFVYAISLKTTPVGTYSFYAVAATPKGSAGTSNTVTITVVSKLPQISLTSPASGSTYAQTDLIVVSASVKDIDSVSFVRFVMDSQEVLAVDSASPYSTTISGLAPGYHFFNAIAVTKSGLSFASASIFVTVSGSQPQAPAISLTGPRDSSTFLSTDTIPLLATVADTSHSVARVSFYADSALLRVDSLVPYAYSWIGAAKGPHTLWASETTFGGSTQSSQPVHVTVK
jgi:hypothetical protein